MEDIHRKKINQLLYLSDEKLITCGEDKQIFINNVITDKSFAIEPNHKGAVRTMALSQDKNYLFTTGDQLEVNVWLVEGWTLLCSLIILDKSLANAENLYISPNNNFLIQFDKSGHVCFWQI